MLLCRGMCRLAHASQRAVRSRHCPTRFCWCRQAPWHAPNGRRHEQAGAMRVAWSPCGRMPTWWLGSAGPQHGGDKGRPGRHGMITWGDACVETATPGRLGAARRRSNATCTKPGGGARSAAARARAVLWRPVREGKGDDTRSEAGRELCGLAVSSPRAREALSGGLKQRRCHIQHAWGPDQRRRCSKPSRPARAECASATRDAAGRPPFLVALNSLGPQAPICFDPYNRTIIST